MAFAPRPALTARGGVAPEAVELAFRTSVHTYVSLGEVLARLAPPGEASLVGLDFDASRAWPTYNWMGVCKAALESANRYLARDLGGFDLLLDAWRRASLPWDPHDAAPVARCRLLLAVRSGPGRDWRDHPRRRRPPRHGVTSWPHSKAGDGRWSAQVHEPEPSRQRVGSRSVLCSIASRSSPT